MATVVALLGVLMLVIAVVGVARPAILVKQSRELLDGIDLMVIATTRLILGAFLLVAAESCRLPALVYAFGAIAVVSALLTPFLGRPRIDALLAWWERTPAWFTRIYSVLIAALGAALVYAGTPP